MRHSAIRILSLCLGCNALLFACSEADTPDQAALQFAEAQGVSSGQPSSSGQCLDVDALADHAEVWIEADTATIGSNRAYPEESPATQVQVAGFWMDVHEVTNAQFADFVQQTGYITSAEKMPDPRLHPDIPAELLKPGSAIFTPPAVTASSHWTQWWQFVEGANWRAPAGPGSNIEGLENHPVIHISYYDALAYAQWRGRELPTEVQWERAAQIPTANLELALPESGQPAVVQPGNDQSANTWQGFFPLQNLLADGFRGSAPVGCFRANEAGLHDMIGNVWEWMSDAYTTNHQGLSVGAAINSRAEHLENPASENPVNESAKNTNNDNRTQAVQVRVIKGGSFLCAANYCRRDRAQGRQPQEEDFGSVHIGFRTVRNIPAESARVTK